jgi:predicted GNAT family acetyltransferase
MESAEIRILTPGDEAALEAFLRPRIASSMFLLGNLATAGLGPRDHQYAGTYAALVRGGAIHSVVAHYRNGNLVLQAPEATIALCRAALTDSGRPVGGLIGPAEQVSSARRALLAGQMPTQLDSTEWLYRLELAELAVPAALAAGSVQARRATQADIPLLTAWRAAFATETLGSLDSLRLRDRIRRNLQRDLEGNPIWILEAEGNPVSMTTFNARLPVAVQVGGVFTPREKRGRGYARSVVAASLVEARAGGAEIGVLFTGQDNVSAQRAYQALGFERVGAYGLLLFRTGEQ